MPRFAIALVAAACGCADADGAPATQPAPPVTPHRVDLRDRPQPFAATIEVPADAVIHDAVTFGVDASGLTTDSPEIHISTAGGSLILLRGAEPAAQDAHYHGARYHLVGERINRDAWARSYGLHDDTCFATGGAPAADVRCISENFEVPCEVAKRLFEICATLEPSGTPVDPPVNLAKTFPHTTSPSDRAVLGSLAVAIAGDHRVAFEAFVPPAGIVIGKRRITASRIHKALETTSIAKLTGLCTGTDCLWSDSTNERHDDSSIEMTPDSLSMSSKNVVRLTRQRDGSWKLAAIVEVALPGDRSGEAP